MCFWLKYHYYLCWVCFSCVFNINSDPYVEHDGDTVGLDIEEVGGDLEMNAVVDVLISVFRHGNGQSVGRRNNNID